MLHRQRGVVGHRFRASGARHRGRRLRAWLRLTAAYQADLRARLLGSQAQRVLQREASRSAWPTTTAIRSGRLDALKGAKADCLRTPAIERPRVVSRCDDGEPWSGETSKPPVVAAHRHRARPRYARVLGLAAGLATATLAAMAVTMPPGGSTNRYREPSAGHGLAPGPWMHGQMLCHNGNQHVMQGRHRWTR